ncbi:MAG: ABC transporter substrate-binding protein [Anaerolineae bacterium]
MTKKELTIKGLTRREFLSLSGAVGAAALLSACGGGGGVGGRTLKVGLVAPITGPLAAFGEADEFVLSQVREIFKDGIDISGVNFPIEIITKDAESDPNRAAQVAQDLILDDEVDLIMVHSTPEINNPVSAQCEANGIPYISTDAPWQPWYFRDDLPSPEAGYTWGYHYFWGLEDVIRVFLELWDEVPNNKVVGALWPNDGDGLAWASPQGFPPALDGAGYTLVDPGRYENLKDDFSAEISLFKEQGVEIVTGVMIPPDMGTFLTQASQQGFNPTFFTVGKAALFPTTIETLPDGLGEGITTEVWWTPTHPFKSSLTGQTAAELGAAYTAETGKQWTQPIGFVHGLFEILADTLARVSDVDSPESIRDAIAATQLDTIVGKIDWSSGPVPNVSKTPLAGGQWQAGGDYPFEMVVATNSTGLDIPITGSVEPKSW